jgi:predicted Zn-dependent protease
MKPLEPPDSMHLDAARGWLGLGNPQEADAELDNLTPALKTHPDVLEVRWHICAYSKQWDGCVAVANDLIKLAPKRSSGWINRANSLYWSGHAQEAFDSLLPAVDRFPKVWAIPYDLACYCAQLGQVDEAKSWLAKAFAIPTSATEKQLVKLTALQDPDLVPIRESTEQL